MTLNLKTSEYWTLKYLLQDELQRIRLKEIELLTSKQMRKYGPLRRTRNELDNIDYKMAKLMYKGAEENE